jgi:conjugative transfer signal peptidase TraF
MSARHIAPSGVEAAFLGLAALALTSAFSPRLVLVNESASLPKGLYVRAFVGAPARGDVVATRPPRDARAYLAGRGAPADLLLLKRVAALDGDEVCARDGLMDIAKLRLATRSHDRDGRPLPAWRGCRRLASDEVFLLGDTPDSFDGRYFGPVRRQALEGVFRPVATW